MSPRKSRGIAGDKTICLPIEEGVQYEDLVQKPKEYRAYLDKMREKYPEIFPEEMEKPTFRRLQSKNSNIQILKRKTNKE